MRFWPLERSTTEFTTASVPFSARSMVGRLRQGRGVGDWSGAFGGEPLAVGHVDGPLVRQAYRMAFDGEDVLDQALRAGVDHRRHHAARDSFETARPRLFRERPTAPG
ncbi:hypothetical protein GCM10010195_53810 [Kitasatospora griseola]|nr:hypothetical protein GCM10010195_53810 [Kitasatospora griseola]